MPKLNPIWEKRVLNFKFNALCPVNLNQHCIFRFDETTLKIQLRQIVFGSFAIDSLPTWRKEHFIQENFPHLKMQLILDTFYTPWHSRTLDKRGDVEVFCRNQSWRKFQLCHENVKLSRSLLEYFWNLGISKLIVSRNVRAICEKRVEFSNVLIVSCTMFFDSVNFDLAGIADITRLT